jgi:cupin 2 domain-containing protein
VSGIVRGQLPSAPTPPGSGEHVETLVDGGGVAIEHILSGRVTAPVDYDQDHDEWVLVLDGSAALEIDHETVRLGAGDWLLLPRATPHRLLETQPGTRWIAVHFGGP